MLLFLACIIGMARSALAVAINPLGLAETRDPVFFGETDIAYAFGLVEQVRLL